MTLSRRINLIFLAYTGRKLRQKQVVVSQNASSGALDSQSYNTCSFKQMFFRSEGTVSRALGGGLYKAVVSGYLVNDLVRNAQRRISSFMKQVPRNTS